MRDRAAPCPSCRCAKLWCTVCPVAAAAATLTEDGGIGSAGRCERRRSERGVRGIVRSAASADAESLPADGLPHGASSPKRGCKDMMVLTRYFRRCAAGLALRTGVVIGLAAILLAGLPEAGWAWGPENWQLGMQPPATPVKEAIHHLHNELLVIIFAIS